MNQKHLQLCLSGSQTGSNATLASWDPAKAWLQFHASLKEAELEYFRLWNDVALL